MASDEPRFLMVLDDGETYSSLEGCKIIQTYDNDETELDLENGVLPAAYFTLHVFGQDTAEFRDGNMILHWHGSK